ncbi:f-box domain protein [Diplodia corticola]|uniref:F-box domain protein n=1 Tax=Diplodia corticola TaxID=236234 RepID=A0A1J9S1T4_9PEZI|nr:f-box domain protein [Diplodia corticola]OJD38907.1 f-box domain protein [Diplodia corticola]
MGFDIFCAVCAGPACAYIHICDKSRKLALREKREENPSFTEKDFDRHEFRGYDPEIVSQEDVQWTYKAQVLGFNPNATGLTKMYISRPANYEDYGCMRGVESDDPNFPQDSDEFQCYRVYDATQTACFPIHEPCLKLLTRVLCGNDNVDNLDKDALYHIISGLMGWGLPELNYGEPSQRYDQCWWSNPGEEMMVTYPLSNPTFTVLLRNTVSTDDFALPAPGTADALTSASLSARVRHDPFARLPYDITHQIALLVPAESVPALATASYTIHAAVRSSSQNPGFWKQALRRCMPWFWELHVLMRHGTVDPDETDFKGLFLWLEACTRPRRGLEGPFMGVANRRRVWGVCEQYDALYVPRLRAKERERAVAAGKGEAAGIWRGAVNTGLPVVAWPVPEGEGLRTSTAQWVCDWDEVKGRSVLEVTWDEERTLMGLTLVVAGERRVFGSDGGGRFESRLKKETVEIEQDCWVQGLILHLPDVFSGEKTETSIKGMTVRTTHRDFKLGDTNPTHCQRLLPISPNHILIGITGQITSYANHPSNTRIRIARLGLLQHLHPFAPATTTTTTTPPPPPPLPLLHQPLWTPTHPSDPLSQPYNSTNPDPIPIPLRALPATARAPNRYQIQSPWHADVVPTHALVFAASPHERRALRRITAWLYEGKHVCCVRAEYARGSGVPAREIGAAGVLRAMRMYMRMRGEGKGEEGEGEGEKDREGVDHGGGAVPGAKGTPMWWREWAAGLREVRLDVDGAGGEEVVGVDVVSEGGIRAVRIRTNEGQVYWGESPIKDYWRFENREAGEGEKIAGIALAFTFGRPGSDEDIAHRWDDGSGMVLRDRLQLSWLATLVANE